MTKSEVVAEMASKAGVTQKDAGACLDAFFEIVMGQVSRGGEVSIPGMIKFSQTDRKARMGRNPQTGESKMIPASKAVKVSVGSKLKAAGKGA